MVIQLLLALLCFVFAPSANALAAVAKTSALRVAVSSSGRAAPPDLGKTRRTRQRDSRALDEKTDQNLQLLTEHLNVSGTRAQAVPPSKLMRLHWPSDPFRNPIDPYAPDPFAANPYLKNPYRDSPSGNSSQATEPFVRVVMDWSHNTTQLKVDLATPNVIVSVYLLMFVPIGMAWVAMHHYGTEENHYTIILAVTLCSLIIGMDLVNQSLSALMESPTAITAIQALAMTFVTGTWAFVSEVQNPTLSFKSAIPLGKWALVALLFALYQLVNHLVSYLCSLSERTVFLNLCPVCSLAAELSLLPRALQPKVSFSQRMALCAMVLGAVLFGLQDPDFTQSGIVSASILVVCLLPYRVFQRWLLMECIELPVSLLAFYDAVVLLVPAWTITAANQDQFWRTWETWFLNSSIVLMLALSWLTFTGVHVCSLLMLRESSATNYLVLHNLSGFIVVFEGIVFFGDRVVQSPLVFAGISISLCSGLCYAVETQLRSGGSPRSCRTSERASEATGLHA